MGSSTVALTTTLDPLPPVLQRGLVAVAFFGLLSLATSGILFIYLTYRLSRWYWQGQLKNGANQFLLLIYNLLLADIQQAMAFALTTKYLVQQKMEVGTTSCFANGWFVSTGDLASGVFILTIALHTFFTIVKGRRISNKVFYAWIAVAWIFIYAMAIVGVALHPGIYVRAGAWCWIDRKYESARLWLHYVWIFICMFGTVVIYALVFVSIRAKARMMAQSTIHTEGSDQVVLRRASKYMIAYPIVYVLSTLPLAGSRMASMTGVSIPYWWFCLAGASITSGGWLDVALYVMTRRFLVFGESPPPVQDFGFDTLGFLAGGQALWGTTTIIEGPLTGLRKERDWMGRNRTAPQLRRKQSDEDHFNPTPDGIVTKTTVEIATGPIHPYADSDLSMIEMEDKPTRARSPITSLT